MSEKHANTGAQQRRNVTPVKKIRQLITKCELLQDRREHNVRALEGWGMNVNVTLPCDTDESLMWMLDRYAQIAKGKTTLRIEDIVVGFSDMRLIGTSTDLKKALKGILNAKEDSTYNPLDPSVICAVCCAVFDRLAIFYTPRDHDLPGEVLRMIGWSKTYLPDTINGKADE